MSLTTVGDRLKILRLDNKLSQEGLADLLGVSRGVITNIEHNKVQQPHPIIRKTLMREFGVREEWLVNGEGEMYSPQHGIPEDAILEKLQDAILHLSESEQRFLLDMIKAVKTYF